MAKTFVTGLTREKNFHDFSTLAKKMVASGQPLARRRLIFSPSPFTEHSRGNISTSTLQLTVKFQFLKLLLCLYIVRAKTVSGVIDLPETTNSVIDVPHIQKVFSRVILLTDGVRYSEGKGTIL
jgi:hypothetical protein